MRNWFRCYSISQPTGQHQLGVLQYDLDYDHPESVQTPHCMGSVPGDCPDSRPQPQVGFPSHVHFWLTGYKFGVPTILSGSKLSRITHRCPKNISILANSFIIQDAQRVRLRRASWLSPWESEQESRCHPGSPVPSGVMKSSAKCLNLAVSIWLV